MVQDIHSVILHALLLSTFQVFSLTRGNRARDNTSEFNSVGVSFLSLSHNTMNRIIIHSFLPSNGFLVITTQRKLLNLNGIGQQ